MQVTGSTWNGAPTGTVQFASVTPLASTVAASGTRSCSPAPPVGCLVYFAQIPTNLAGGSYNYAASFASGNSAYNTPPASVTSLLTVQAASTTTSAPIPSLPSGQTYGTQISLSANVAAVSPGSGIPTGTVTFKDGTTVLGTFNVLPNGSVGTATSTNFLPTAGNHTFTAEFLTNSGSFQNSVGGATPYTVAQATVTTSLVSTPSVPPVYSGGPVFGQPVTFTATLPPVSGSVPTGSIRFADQTAGTTLATVAVDGISGQAAYTTSSLSVGTHTISATYLPTVGGNFVSNGVVTTSYTVAKTEANFTIVPSTTTANRGQTINITVTGTPVLGTNPSGSVTLTENGVPSGTQTLVGGTTTFSLTLNTVGPRTLGLTYSGDATFLDRPGVPGQTVLPAPVVTVAGSATTTAVTSNPHRR